MPPFASIFNVIGPLGHILAAAGVVLARVAGFDELLGMRLVYWFLASLTVGFVYLLGRTLFGSRPAALASAAAFLSFELFAHFAVAGPREDGNGAIRHDRFVCGSATPLGARGCCGGASRPHLAACAGGCSRGHNRCVGHFTQTTACGHRSHIGRLRALGCRRDLLRCIGRIAVARRWVPRGESACGDGLTRLCDSNFLHRGDRWSTPGVLGSCLLIGTGRNARHFHLAPPLRRPMEEICGTTDSSSSSSPSP